MGANEWTSTTTTIKKLTNQQNKQTKNPNSSVLELGAVGNYLVTCYIMDVVSRDGEEPEKRRFDVEQ